MFTNFIRLLVIAVMVFYISSCSIKSPGYNQKKLASADTINQIAKMSAYEGMRGLALGVTTDQIDVQLPNDKTKVYGVVMDWDFGKGTATFVSFLSGDAKLYLSSGGGFFGGGEHEKVKQATIEFINNAGHHLGKTIKTETTPLPDKNGIKFYFLTNKGKFVATEQMSNIENNSSEWVELFEEGNKIITEIRNTPIRARFHNEDSLAKDFDEINKHR